jgi:hypothetical protein
MTSDCDYTVLVSPWNRQWDVYVLHPVDGLIGSAVARNLADVEPAARAVLGRCCGNERHRISLTVLQRAAT